MHEQRPQPDIDHPEQPSTPAAKASFPVVGLGASAGGLQALQQFFAAMPANSGMAFVVIMHLSPDHESHAAAILQQSTTMPVTQVMETTRIEPNAVYVIPPTHHLAMEDGMIHLSDFDLPTGRHVAVDLFFRTLAETHTTSAVCIVLSGTGSDGTLGIQRVKEAGGITMAQDPEDAEYDSMPRNAINTGAIDFVLPVSEMPEQLLTVWRNARQIALPAAIETPRLDPSQTAELVLRDILAAVRMRTGHDFTHYKRATILRRLERRMQVTTTPNLPAYYAYLSENPAEVPLLLQDLLIGVTNFFRDRSAFDALEREVIPKIFENKTTGDTVRVWVVGCASGEEAYSVAILLLEHAQRMRYPPAIQIFATDIDENAIQTARDGSYPQAIEADIAPARLQQFFTKETGSYRVTKVVRECVLFAVHNLIRDPPFLRLDLLTCRNLLIYLNRDVQEQVFELFHFVLRPRSFLFLGSSESLDGSSDLFETIDKKHRLFQVRTATSTLRSIPILPVATPASRSRSRSSSTIERRQIVFGELHQRILEEYAPPSIIVNADSEILHLSEHAGRFIQLTGGEPSLNLLKVVLPELRSELRTALFQAFQTGKSTEARRVQLVRDGRTTYVNIVARPKHDDETNADFAIVLFDEVEAILGTEGIATETDTVEPVVRHLEAETQRLKEQVQATAEQYETSLEELKASNEELQAINEELRATTEELETSKEELQSVNEELQTVNHELQTNIDDLSAANDDLKNLMSATDIAILFLDRNLNITRYTPRTLDLFNLIPSDEGRQLAHVTHNLVQATLVADAASVLQTLQPIEREIGSRQGRYYLTRTVPYRTVSDHIDGIVLTFVDITERRQAEAELANAYSKEQAARLEVEAALQTRDQFLSIASHELRTPLTSLMGYTQWLQKNPERDRGEIERVTERILRQSDRLNQLIGQLLDVSRLKQGQFSIEQQRIDIVSLTEQIIQEFRATLPSTPAYTVTVVHPNEQMFIRGDAARLEQVLINLLSNAVKYSPLGGNITVELTHTASDVLIAITDQGVGMSAQAQIRLFEPFYRATNARFNTSGFGLGLYIVQEVVQRHGGRVEVMSREDAGSTFRIVLPAASDDHDADAVARHA